MKIYTSYFANKAKLEAQGIVQIGVCLYPPRWFRGANMRCVAPTKEIFAISDVPDEVYVPRFKNEILAKVNPAEFVRNLESLSGGRDVALCCFEKNSKECHRIIIADWLKEKLGIDVPEFGAEKKKEEVKIEEKEPELF